VGGASGKRKADGGSRRSFRKKDSRASRRFFTNIIYGDGALDGGQQVLERSLFTEFRIERELILPRKTAGKKNIARPASEKKITLGLTHRATMARALTGGGNPL